MKKLLYTIAIVLFCSLLANAQNEKLLLPLDSITHLITFTDVVLIDSSSKDEIYLKAREWVAKTYNSSKSVIEIEDKENGKIIGNGICSAGYNTLSGGNYCDIKYQ